MKLLHVDASARSRSFSRQVSAELVSTLRELEPGLEYRHRDLATEPVPHITEAWTQICDNLMADGITALDRLHEGVRTPAQQEAWAVLARLLDEVVEADVIVLATPMYNYSIPSALKAWLDQITFPRMNLGDRRFVVVASRGGSYAPGTPKAPVEHQTRYLADFLPGHFAVAPPVVVTVDLANAVVDPLLADLREAHDISLEHALSQARRVARSLHEDLPHIDAGEHLVTTPDPGNQRSGR